MMLHRGWEDMSNFTKEFQQPFQLYREGGSTYLQVSKLVLNLNIQSETRSFLHISDIQQFSVDGAGVSSPGAGRALAFGSFALQGENYHIQRLYSQCEDCLLSKMN